MKKKRKKRKKRGGGRLFIRATTDGEYKKGDRYTKTSYNNRVTIIFGVNTLIITKTDKRESIGNFLFFCLRST